MSILNQKTIKEKISLSGIGLHTGQKVEINLLPSTPNTGIIFKRIDLSKNNIVIPSFENVIDTTLCTTLSNEHGVKVSTVEHLLAAFYIVGIDNAMVEIDNEEIPIMDGSSKDFIKVIEKIDLQIQSKKRKYLKISEKIELIDGKRRISIEPNESSLQVNFQLKYENKIIGNQKNIIDFQSDNLDEVVSSRTFCLFEDIEKIKRFGLAKGGSLDNAVVVEKNKILNEGGLRNDKEFVNHKILDCLGDIFLAGYRMVGKITSSQGGHNVTNQGLRELLSNNENFSIIELKEKNIPHSFLIKNPLKSTA